MKKLAFITFILLLASCKKDVFNENFSYLYGDWIPVQVSSGLNYSAKPELLGNLIQILKNGSYKIIRNDKTVESGHLSIEIQTIDQLTIKFVPKEIDFGSDSFVRLNHSSLNVTTFTQDSIHLHNNAVDAGYFSLIIKRKE
ncbi:MAG: hypothetical protein ACM3Q2_15080 [Syntrophothermus sp.]